MNPSVRPSLLFSGKTSLLSVSTQEDNGLREDKGQNESRLQQFRWFLLPIAVPPVFWKLAVEAWEFLQGSMKPLRALTWFPTFFNPWGLTSQDTGDILSSFFLLSACTFTHPGKTRILRQFQNKNIIGIQRSGININLKTRVRLFQWDCLRYFF